MADYVYYEQRTTLFHGTLLAAIGWHDLARWLAPDVSPTLVRLILGRDAYSTPQERDAETLASLMLQRATAWPGPPGDSG